MNIEQIRFGAALALLALPAAAQPVNCANASTQFDINRCAAADLGKADAGLNRAYAQALARLTPGSKARLRDAQRAWIAFRDKQCAFEANGADGGSVSPMVAMNCATGLTSARARDLASTGKCVEGDVSCAR